MNILQEQVSRTRLLVFDFDGVMTDNSVLVFQDGSEAVICSRGDGMGITLLRKAGFPMLVLSTEENPVVMARCRKLHLECMHGIEDKLPELQRIAAERAYFHTDANTNTRRKAYVTRGDLLRGYAETAEFIAVKKMVDETQNEQVDPLGLMPGVVLNEGGTGIRDSLMSGGDVFVLGVEEK